MPWSAARTKTTHHRFTSDHGQYLGEKAALARRRFVEEATRVPLVVCRSSRNAGWAQTNQPVSLVDIYPSLCDLVALPKPKHLDGESLVPLLKDPASKRERPALTASVKETRPASRAHQIVGATSSTIDGSEELYDHASDPHEWTNLARRPEQEATVKQLFGMCPSSG